MAIGEEITSGTSIKQLFQGMVGEGAEVLQGIIKSVSPLKIQIVNDSKLIVGPSSVYVPRHLTDYTTAVDIAYRDSSVMSMPDINANISGATMTVHNALKTGELVHVLSFNHGKQYFILGRVS